MRKKIIFILGPILSFIFLNKVSAEIRLGPTIAINFSGMTWEPIGTVPPQRLILREQIGLISEVKLYKNIFLRHGLLLNGKGGRYLLGKNELVIAPWYIELPINLLAKVPVKNTKLNVLFLGGMFFDYALGGTYKYSFWENVQDIKYGTGQQNDLKEIDFGLNCGIGVEFRKVSLIAKYDHGLMNLTSDKTSNGVMKSRVFAFSFCILFGEKVKTR